MRSYALSTRFVSQITRFRVIFINSSITKTRYSPRFSAFSILCYFKRYLNSPIPNKCLVHCYWAPKIEVDDLPFWRIVFLNSHDDTKWVVKESFGCSVLYFLVLCFLAACQSCWAQR